MMLKKCKDCGWNGPLGISTLYPGIKANKAPRWLAIVHSAMIDYLRVYYTKMRCRDCGRRRPCPGERPDLDWGYCRDYTRKAWKIWRPK